MFPSIIQRFIGSFPVVRRQSMGGHPGPTRAGANPPLAAPAASVHARRCPWLVVVASLWTFACSTTATDQFGDVALALTSTSNGTTYRLEDATFEIEGVVPATLTSDPETAVLELELPVGEYTAELQAGWRLLEVAETGEQPIDATLTSENPIGFSILADQTTQVVYRFETQAGDVGFGQGLLELSIDVTRRVAREVIFSEVMKNPTVLGDTAGEWVELMNTGTETVSLTGCVLRRDDSEVSIEVPLSIEPGQHVVFANSDAPGFPPDFVYSTITLPNSAAFALELRCQDEVLDRVEIDPNVTPNAAGASLSLDPASASANGNDAADAWCDASTEYNGDRGTPGTENPACP